MGDFDFEDYDYTLEDPRFDPTSALFDPELYFINIRVESSVNPDSSASVNPESSEEELEKKRKKKRLLLTVVALITVSSGIVICVKTGIFSTALKKLTFKGSKTLVRSASKLPVLKPPVKYLNIPQHPLNRFSAPANFSEAEILFERANWVKILLDPENLPRPKRRAEICQICFSRLYSTEFFRRNMANPLKPFLRSFYNGV